MDKERKTSLSDQNFSNAVLALLFCTLLSLGCDNNVSPPFTIDLERAEDVAFGCFDETELIFVELSRCDFVTDNSLRDQYSTVALVTQTSRGEVAAVDLDVGRILDTDIRVPGSTFVKVGNSPSAIVVSPQDPRWTFVASFGSKTLEAIATDLFHPSAKPSELAKQTLVLEGRPSDMVISPDGKYLYVTLPFRGVLLEIPIQSAIAGLEDDAAQLEFALQGPLGEPRRIELLSDVEAPLLVDEETFEESYEKLCSDRMQSSSPDSFQRVFEFDPALSPMPLRIFVDEDKEKLLVSDGNLPKIHMLDLQDSGQFELTGTLNPGVAVESVVASPLVPGSLAGSVDDDPHQYLYAIEKQTGHVLVMDYLTDSPNYGRVLPVSPNSENPDRIDLGTRVNTLSVVHSDPEGELCDDDVNASSLTGPTRLRGVFLFAGMIDGTIRVVDIYDLDAICRGGIDCASSGEENLEEIYLRRHRPRIGELVFSIPAVNGTPVFQDQGVSGSLSELGEISEVSDFGLVPMAQGCPLGFTQGFPHQEGFSPLVCIDEDPWQIQFESWAIQWEGTLKGTEGNSGRFSESLLDGDDGEGWVAQDIDFCKKGVLGSFNTRAIPPELFALESSYQGDVLVITEEIDLNDQNCAPFVNRSSEDNNFRSSTKLVGFKIEASYSRFLKLGAPVGSYSLEDVKRCFPKGGAFQIQVDKAFTVTGSQTGFEHRVISGESGVCEIDTRAEFKQKQGRALSNRLFANSQIAFQVKSALPVGAFGSLEIRKLNWSIHNIPTPLFLDTASVAETIQYNPRDERLYVINSTNQVGISSTRGPLIVFELNPLRTIRSFQ